MFELPPDASRLRTILDFLDEQVARNQTIGTYLVLQQKAVRHALSVAEAQAAAVRSPLRPRSGPGRSPVAIPPAERRERRQQGFMVEQRRTASGPEEATVHQDDCTMAGQRTHRVGAHDARLALTDGQLEACAFCRPDTELGIFG